MADIDFVGQLVDSMEKAVQELEVAIKSNKTDEANRLKTFVFDLHMQIDKALRTA